MSELRVAVVGSRDFPHLSYVWGYLDGMEEQVWCVVSGGARGVDAASEEWALTNDKRLVSFRPVKLRDGEWAVDRKRWNAGDDNPMRPTDHMLLPGRYPSFAAAAYVRNGFIVDFADVVVAFWDGQSRGTKDSVAKARAADKLRDVVPP